MSTVTAIVAARGGSVRLPGKALLPFGDTTLIGHKARTLKRCALVDRIVVNSDSPDITAAAVAEGAEAIEGGGRDYGGDARAMLEDSARRAGGDVILWAHPTNPLVTADTYDRAIDAYFARPLIGYDSLISVYEIRRHAWFKGRALNYDPAAVHKLAADCWPVCFQDGSVFVQEREQMIRNRYFFGERPLLFVIPPGEVCDVDTQEDYLDANRRFAAGAKYARLPQSERVRSGHRGQAGGDGSAL